MLDKLLKALVLLIIGTASGLLIWGTNALTEERIELNRERARLSVFIDMFDIQDDWYTDLDELRALLKTEPVEHSSVIEKTTVYDNQGNIIGYALRGTDNNAFGYVDTIVGVTPDGEIIDVVIADHNNTETYVRPLIDNYLVNFKGQMLSSVEFDASTGATATYNSVRKVVEDSVLLIEGDPVLSAYQNLISGVERYETTFTFTHGSVKEEVALYGEDDTLLAYAYLADVTVNDESATVAVGVEDGDVFLGIEVITEDAPDELNELLEAYDDAIGASIDDVDVSLDGDLGDVIGEIVDHAFLRAVEDEDTRMLRELFFEAKRKGDAVDIDHELLVSVTPIYDDSDNVIGHVYDAEGQGYAYFDGIPIVMQVAIDTDGTVSSVVIISDSETTGFKENAMDELDGYIGLDDVTEYDQDVYAGATATGDAIYEVVGAALEDFQERFGD